MENRRLYVDFDGADEVLFRLKVLQSDDYNVYMYLDDEREDTQHLCCLAHVRVKFKYASEQGGDRDVAFFLEAFGELYQPEDEYEVS